MTSHRYLWPIAIAAALTAPLAGHEGHAPLPTKGVEVDIEKGTIVLSREAYVSLGVQTSVVESRALKRTVLAYATLETPWQAQCFVSSPTGGRIAKLPVRMGELVEAGQMLGEIASPELESLQLELRNAINEQNRASAEVARLTKLTKDRIVAERDLIEAQSGLDQSRNAVLIARSKLRSLGLSDSTVEAALDRGPASGGLLLPLVSPIQGVVTHSDLGMGRVVVANDHLFKVSDLSKMWVRIGVLERDATAVRVGQSVELEFSSFPGEPCQATITQAGTYVDPQSHLVVSWAELQNSSQRIKYLPGMYGTAKITVSEPIESATIPTSALLGMGAERYVLIEEAATKKGYELRRQNVVVAERNSKSVQLRGGDLYPGDRVVSVGAQVLSSFFVLGSLRLSPEGIRNAGLRVERVGKQVVEEVVMLEGMVDLPSGQVALVSSPIPGTLARILVDRGEEVRTGQLIAEVTSLKLQDLQLEMLRADLDAELLGKTITRLESTGETQVVASRRIIEAKAARDEAANRRQSLRQTLLTLGMSVDDVTAVLKNAKPVAALAIRSPIDGVLVRSNHALGEGVDSDKALFEIHDLSQPWMKAFVPESQVAKIRVGMPARARLMSHPQFQLSGIVGQSSQNLGVDNRAMETWIKLSQENATLVSLSTSESPPASERQTSQSAALPRLQRYLLARISVTTELLPATLAVPLSAIVREGTRQFVFVELERGLLERRAVRVGRADDRFVEITEGLKLGDRVAVEGIPELQTTYATIR